MIQFLQYHRLRSVDYFRRRDALNSASSSIRSTHEITEEEEDDLGSEFGDFGGGEASPGGESSVQRAWQELADIEREQERWAELRHHLEEKLEGVRRTGVELEDVSIA